MSTQPEKPDQLVYREIVDALFLRALAGKLAPEALRQLAACGLDLAQPLAESYPTAAFWTWVGVACKHVFPDASPERAEYQVGELLTHGYMSGTLIGRMTSPLLKILTPTRALVRIVQNLKSGNNFVSAHLTQLSPKTFELAIEDADPHPHLVAGSMAAAMGFSSALNPRVEVAGKRDRSFTLRVTWGA